MKTNLPKTPKSLIVCLCLRSGKIVSLPHHAERDGNYFRIEVAWPGAGWLILVAVGEGGFAVAEATSFGRK